MQPHRIEPSANFINEVLGDSIKAIFEDINQKIFETEHVDLQHLYIDRTKFEANANKYSWVWKKATEKSRYRLFGKITKLLQEINEEIACTVTRLCIQTGYAPEYLKEVAGQYAQMWQSDKSKFIYAEKGETAIPRQTIPQPLCVSRPIIWEMTSCFLPIMSRWLPQRNI